MPAKNPIIQVVVDPETHAFFVRSAKELETSISKAAAKVLKEKAANTGVMFAPGSGMFRAYLCGIDEPVAWGNSFEEALDNARKAYDENPILRRVTEQPLNPEERLTFEDSVMIAPPPK